jgi:hypothetical protein
MRPPAPAARVAAAPSPARAAIILFVGLWAVYVLNFRMMSAGDSLPTRVLPFSVLREGNLNLDEFGWELNSRGKLPYYLHLAPGGHIYSVSTLGTGLAVTPLYVLPAWWLSAAAVPYDDVRARVVITAMERIAAATLTALSATLLFMILRRLTTWRAALALTLVYGVGTSTWSIASQALWPHALAELCLVAISAVLLHPRPSRWALAAAGIATAMMVVNRPQMVVFAAPAFLFVAFYRRRDVLAFIAVPLLAALLLVAYNSAVFGRATGGYGGFAHFGGSLFTGIAGLLVSPNRGLFIYTPIMLFAVWGAIEVWRRQTAPPWVRWLTIAVVLHILFYAKFKEWWAGYAFGPRYFTDVLPALTIFLVYGLVPLWRHRVVRIAAVILVVYGIVVQSIGVYAATDKWNREPARLEKKPGRVWDWTDLQIVRGWREGWKGGELAGVMFDAFRDRVPARVAPLAVADLASTVVVTGVPREVRRGADVPGVAKITNTSSVGWPAFSGEGVISARYLVFVLARWVANGQPIPQSGDVFPLPENVAPGDTVEMRFTVPAPSQTGELQLEFRVTQAVDALHGLASDDAARVPVRVR